MILWNPKDKSKANPKPKEPQPEDDPRRKGVTPDKLGVAEPKKTG